VANGTDVGVLYGCETWTLRREEIDNLEALQMWLWRSLENIKWHEKISNDEVLTIVDENRCLIRTIGEMKKNWIGHALRGDLLLRDVLKERKLGSRPWMAIN
jgi:ABC-type enterobactin transport system permease subunit